MTPLKSFFFTRKSKGEEKSLKRSFEWKSFHLAPFFLTFARRERVRESRAWLEFIATISLGFPLNAIFLPFNNKNFSFYSLHAYSLVLNININLLKYE